jgi:nucleoside-diphosphate-sugar epimerase
LTDRRRILITGAAGLVAGILREHWGDRYALRLADIAPVANADGHETIRMDITKLDEFRAACDGVDTVIHLAADRSPRAGFYETLLDLNIVGAYNGFQAAKDAGCRRIVFASSVHAVLGYDGETPVEWDAPIYPTNVYGATKCWGEALGRVFSEQALSCICVRLGSPRFEQNGDWDPDKPSMGISRRDTAHLFERCVLVDDLPYAVVHALSHHRKPWMAIDHTRRILGYTPIHGTAFPRG